MFEFVKDRLHVPLDKLSPNLVGGIAVVGVAIIGTVLLLVTRAAVQDWVSVEPEQGAVTAPASVQDDTQASGGKVVRFGVPATSGLADIPKDCSVNVTAQLNAFIAAQPDGSTIDFPTNACYVINGTLSLSGRKNLTFNGNGSTFKQVAVPPAKTGVPQWQITGGSGIILSNMTIQGVHTTSGFDVNHEWDHNIDIRGAAGITIDKVTGKNAGGDFVTIQPNTNVPMGADGAGAIIPKTIKVTNSTATLIGRNAVSCTGCEDVLVDHNTFSDMGYVGFDMEIEAKTWYGRNIRVTNNTWGAVNLSFFGGSGTGLDTTDITIANNIMTKRKTCQPPINLDASTPRANVTITGNTLLGYQLAIGVNRTKNLKITDNKMQVIDGQCGSPVTGVVLTDVDVATLTGNDFTGSATPFRAGVITRVTNYTACGNKLPGGTGFNYPTACAAP